MTCAEFQRVLPYIIETGGNADEEAHLRSCGVCSDLVRDLRYIAEQAKLLVPMEDPPARVWEGIEASLKRQGVVQPARRGRLLGRGRKGAIPWFAGIAALALVALVSIVYQRRPQAPASAMAETPFAMGAESRGLSASNDEQVLAEVAAQHPDLRDVYATSLQQVNDAIADARSVLQGDPTDTDGRRLLEKAYAQKSMIYEMALSNSLP